MAFSIFSWSVCNKEMPVLDEAEWTAVSAKRGMKPEERVRDQFTEALN
jgi:hypothetical protein